MSEKSLRQISDEAQEHYQNDKAPATDHVGYSAKEIQEFIQDHDNLPDDAKNASEHAKRFIPKEYNLLYRLGAVEAQDASTADAAKARMQENAAAYHDIAVIDAHMDGVKINVQQPIEIGERIEVHTSDQQ